MRWAAPLPPAADDPSARASTTSLGNVTNNMFELNQIKLILQIITSPGSSRARRRRVARTDGACHVMPRHVASRRVASRRVMPNQTNTRRIVA